MAVHGAGINDAPYAVARVVNGQQEMCPIYSIWRGVLTRCFDEKYQSRQPTYVGAQICDEWLYFMEFRSWVVQQEWKENQIDKDIICPGNMVYSPEKCCMVSRGLNNLIRDYRNKSFGMPVGVFWVRREDCFHAMLMIKGKSMVVGRFDFQEEAEDTYNFHKGKHIREVAMNIQDERVKEGLIKHALLTEGGVSCH